jgi:hypothetical protein
MDFQRWMIMIRPGKKEIHFANCLPNPYSTFQLPSVELSKRSLIAFGDFSLRSVILLRHCSKCAQQGPLLLFHDLLT